MVGASDSALALADCGVVMPSRSEMATEPAPVVRVRAGVDARCCGSAVESSKPKRVWSARSRASGAWAVAGVLIQTKSSEL